ncbi:DEKNAAC104331 [Brettanomyces naardenensis]|uniref:DEKNAAC104331 n=1 Tax=Brettanomyces naardenensis TaxID=13370 RepID=A0A448YQQ6_BRENA|nr:DEKNAAC104331 [Brettanomyces naardenensis]
MLQAPHLLTEDYTSPVLDSTVELITSQNLNEVDVVQLSHSNPQSTLLRSVKQRSSCAASSCHCTNGSSSPVSRRQSEAQLSTLPTASPCACGEDFARGVDAGRKSISFYSYSDLVNYERASKLSRDLVMSPASASVGTDTDSPNMAPLNLPEMLDGPNGDSQPQLPNPYSPPSTTDDNFDIFSISSERPQDNINSVSSTGNVDDAESTHVWSPFSGKLRSMSESANQEDSFGTRLESSFSGGATFDNNMSSSEDITAASPCSPNYVEEPVNVCSAKDFLQSKSRQLRNSVTNTSATVSGSPSITVGGDSSDSLDK